MPYLDQGEFYGEFGNFDVRITVPEDYVVAATGELIEGVREGKGVQEKPVKVKKTPTKKPVTKKTTSKKPV